MPPCLWLLFGSLPEALLVCLISRKYANITSQRPPRGASLSASDLRDAAERARLSEDSIRMILGSLGPKIAHVFFTIPCPKRHVELDLFPLLAAVTGYVSTVACIMHGGIHMTSSRSLKSSIYDFSFRASPRLRSWLRCLANHLPGN